ncbi:c-type cytochrome biogenesis protein CcmI [Bordetella petrii]|uniref:c-type cytochrome biogenesis protein CcmI n=1 Tax=Bordetella petrii TaxID=94624 RepID=UPI001E4DE4EA|nr:c-type cytochrome biogenesis protein CcmI [Bordetella petrii]MCD0501411.1 c-type cytochrome biogenesis protein CcmI [Bordetella petrii]
MMEFWLPATVLLAVALACVLVPLLRRPAADAAGDADRAAVNAALYHERLRDLETQYGARTLTASQLAAGRTEAARELLENTGRATQPASTGKRGVGLGLVAALSVPIVGAVLYMHWGSLDEILLSRSQGGGAGHGIPQMTARLEASLESAPDSVEGWILLGRTYQAQDRHADAAKAFERASMLAGRAPALLGLWAQALYFAHQQQWTPQVQSLIEEALAADPAEASSLTLAGLAAFETGRYQAAADYWQRLAAALPDQDPARATLAQGIARARDLARAPESAATVKP